MKDFLHFISTICPIVGIMFWNWYCANLYIGIAGVVLVCGILYLSSKIICGEEMTREDVLKDKDIKKILRNKSAFSAKEYEKISSPEFWIGLSLKLKAVLVGSYGIIILLVWGLLLYLLSAKTAIDSAVFFGIPSCYLVLYSRVIFFAYFSVYNLHFILCKITALRYNLSIVKCDFE